MLQQPAKQARYMLAELDVRALFFQRNGIVWDSKVMCARIFSSNTQRGANASTGLILHRTAGHCAIVLVNESKVQASVIGYERCPDDRFS
jgi:hypothetical protein